VGLRVREGEGKEFWSEKAMDVQCSISENLITNGLSRPLSPLETNVSITDNEIHSFHQIMHIISRSRGQ
jgi:hypothetical protein